MSNIIFKAKVLVVGEGAVGKTSLIQRFVNDVFNTDYAATIGVKFLTKKVSVNPDNDNSAQLSLWDVAGQPRFEDLRTTFYSGAGGALFVFDLTRKITFEKLDQWHAEVVKMVGEIPHVVIGNKADLKRREISIEEAQMYAQKNHSLYIETSAKSGLNVEQAFLELTYLMAKDIEGVKPPKQKIRKPSKKQHKKAQKIDGPFFVKSKVRNYIKSNGLNTSKSILNGTKLNQIILNILDNAIEKAIANGRKTVQPKDL
ncbi:MAG: GTP-binding protein [Promethearchaeota archaeon]